MKKIRTKYLVKCEIPGCSNIALNMFTINDQDVLGLPICERCVKEISDKKRMERKNEKEN